MIERHAFGEFVPSRARYLILGTFTGRVDGSDPGYDWFYCTKRNQFWSIIEQVYDLDLRSTEAKIELFTTLGIALADTISSCERVKASNLDSSLRNVEYNRKGLAALFEQSQVETVLFSSRLAEKLFNKHILPELSLRERREFKTLPSPSPRFASLTLSQKVLAYRALLPSVELLKDASIKKGRPQGTVIA